MSVPPDQPVSFEEHVKPLFRERDHDVDALRVRPLVARGCQRARRRDPRRSQDRQHALRRSLAARPGRDPRALDRGRQAGLASERLGSRCSTSGGRSRARSSGWPANWPPGQSWQRTARRGLRMPARPSTPPTATSVVEMPMPTWKAWVEADLHGICDLRPGRGRIGARERLLARLLDRGSGGR